ncbi:hypothetical protein Rhopal_007169-T1 [Rhodotorula paludigena]|uniref:Borealin N-terminal domain-containing protein n=1 Tax=Rhodotorula paludigena TaxID=86838 RepID=A0AAV5GX87_9BASI|nr:hypothetical protein Rhopal_007169-T1 [Rhodotorula paludigena]
MATRTAARAQPPSSAQRKASARAPKTVILDDPPQDDLLDSAQLQALKEDFDLETASFLRSLVRKSDERLAALERHFADTLASLDDQVRALSLGRFVGEFGADPNAALRVLVEEKMRPPPISQVEQSARKRKRVLPVSPRGTLDDDDIFATSKKARNGGKGGQLFSSAAKKQTASVSRTGSLRSRNGAGLSPTSSRKPRLRLRPSTSTSSSSNNFVYRTNPLLPPTPAFRPTSSSSVKTPGGGGPGTQRRPRRGESIIMRSVNGSPLGEYVASDDDGGDGDGAIELDDLCDSSDERSEGGEDEDWDLMERNEASNVEHQSAGKTKKGGRAAKVASKGKAGAGTSAKNNKLTKSSSTRSVVVPPSSAAFDVALPAGAPSFEALKSKWMDDMRAKLAKAEMSDADRKRLEEVLLATDF